MAPPSSWWKQYTPGTQETGPDPSLELPTNPASQVLRSIYCQDNKLSPPNEAFLGQRECRLPGRYPVADNP